MESERDRESDRHVIPIHRCISPKEPENQTKREEPKDPPKKSRKGAQKDYTSDQLQVLSDSPKEPENQRKPDEPKDPPKKSRKGAQKDYTSDELQVLSELPEDPRLFFQIRQQGPYNQHGMLFVHMSIHLSEY